MILASTFIKAVCRRWVWPQLCSSCFAAVAPIFRQVIVSRRSHSFDASRHLNVCTLALRRCLQLVLTACHRAESRGQSKVDLVCAAKVCRLWLQFQPCLDVDKVPTAGFQALTLEICEKIGSILAAVHFVRYVSHYTSSKSSNLMSKPYKKTRFTPPPSH